LPVNLKALSSHGGSQTSGNCPEGMGWNDKTQECESICEAFDVNNKFLRGFCEDVIKGLEDALIQAKEECSKRNGMKWDESENICVIDINVIVEEHHDCGSGYHWDEGLQSCMIDDIEDPQQGCENNGGRWNGSSCEYNNNECYNGYDQSGNACGESICNNGVDQYGNSCGGDESNDEKCVDNVYKYYFHPKQKEINDKYNVEYGKMVWAVVGTELGAWLQFYFTDWDKGEPRAFFKETWKAILIPFGLFTLDEEINDKIKQIEDREKEENDLLDKETIRRINECRKH
jgi:hypothetical protein